MLTPNGYVMQAAGGESSAADVGPRRTAGCPACNTVRVWAETRSRATFERRDGSDRDYLSETTMPDSRKRCPMKNSTTGGSAAPIETAMIRCQGLEP